MKATGIKSDRTLATIRKELVNNLKLIQAEGGRGRSVKTAYTVLNLINGEPFKVAEYQRAKGSLGYFQVPHYLLWAKFYATSNGCTIQIYANFSAEGNRRNTPLLRFKSNTEMAKTAGVSLNSFKKHVKPLTEGDAPFLDVRPNVVEIYNPETGKSLSDKKADDIFFMNEAGTRASVNNLLTPENFKKYFTGELPELKPELVQQDVCCPFHGDSNPSLSVNLEAGVWCCHVCTPTNGTMLAFEMKKLGTEDKREAWHGIARKLGVRLVRKPKGKMTNEHNYTDEFGELLYSFRRYEDGSGRFLTPTVDGKLKARLNGVKRVLYNLPDVKKADTVVITEGEKKADVVNALGLCDADGKPVAVTCSGGADSWRVEFAEQLEGKRVVLLPDSDEGGQEYAAKVRASLIRSGVEHKVADFRDYGNDVRDFLKEHTAEDLADMVGLTTRQAAAVGSIGDI
jgi:CHC2 zinc finger